MVIPIYPRRLCAAGRLPSWIYDGLAQQTHQAGRGNTVAVSEPFTSMFDFTVVETFSALPGTNPAFWRTAIRAC